MNPRNPNFNNIRNIKRQGGFSILGVILIVVAIVAVLGVWAMSGATNTDNGVNSTATTRAATLLSDASAVKVQYDSLIAKGYGIGSITFAPGVSDPTNILDPVNGIQKPIPNPQSVGNNGSPYDIGWLLDSNMKLDSIGTSAGADPTLIVMDVTDAICTSINTTLHGDPMVPVTAQSFDSLSNGATAANPVSANNVNLVGTAGMASWKAGCFRATGTSGGASSSGKINVFFFNLATS